MAEILNCQQKSKLKYNCRAPVIDDKPVLLEDSPLLVSSDGENEIAVTRQRKKHNKNIKGTLYSNCYYRDSPIRKPYLIEAQPPPPQKKKKKSLQIFTK